MSSSEEERLVQMVEDFIESESSSPIFSASSACLPHTQYLTLQEIVGSGTQVEAEILESVLRHMRSNKREAKKTSSLKKWLVMKHKMDGYNASLCHTSWLTSLGCPACLNGSLACHKVSAAGENKEPKGGAHGHVYSKWAPSPPMVKSKRSNLAGGSALSSQFSNMSINCC
uniref:Uncharacterized protein n=1 Tax=Fagus sylvatica TaxID=28930 RepID=A0A2N9H3E9_FAGSY